MPQVKIKVFSHQIKFINSYAPSTGLIAGFGAGKSWAGTAKCIERLKQFHTDIGYYLPTYQLIKDIAFKNFTEQLANHNIPFSLHETDKVFKTPLGDIYLRSIDKPQSIIGYQTGYALIDEADIPPKDKTEKAYKAIVARNRLTLPYGYENATDMVSTPEGFKFLYEYYVKNSNDRRVIIQANTLDNTTLPQSYIDNLYDTYPAEQLDAYMRGQFVNLSSGTVYKYYNREIHDTDVEVTKNEALHIGMDFNVNNMSAVVHLKRGKILYAVDEFTSYEDTRELCKAIRYRYPNSRILVYPDASGGNRSTNSSESDIDIIKSFRYTVKANKKNPFVKDRINVMNNAFEKKTYFVNSSKCPEYSDALMQLPYKNGKPDKDSGFDHITDAGGYFVYFINSGSKHIAIR